MTQILLDKIDKLVLKIFRRLLNFNSQHYFILLGIFTVLPLFLLSFFNNPGSDDFDYEFKRPFTEIIKTQIELYNGWSGRFFSVGFMTINPDFFIEYSFSKFYPSIIICLFLVSLFWFFKSIFPKENYLTIFSLVGFFTFLFCLQLPDLCQAIFWYSSSICYQFGIVLFLFFISSFIKFKRSKSFLFLFISILTAIASIGSNEILMLIVLLLSVWYLILKFIKLKKIDFYEIILFINIVIFSIIVLVAPGNSARLAREGVIENHNLIQSIVKTIFYFGSYCFKWFPVIVVSSLLFSGQLKNILKKIEYQNVFMHPIQCLIIISTILFPCFFVGFWTYNSLLPERAINSIFFFFQLFSLYFIFCVFVFFKSKFKLEFDFPKSNKVVFGVVLFFLVFSNNPISQAYFDLISGKAYKYNLEFEERHTFITNSNLKHIEVLMLKNRPKTIYNSDVMGLTTDKNNWKNLEIARYYRKESIVIRPTDSLITE